MKTKSKWVVTNISIVLALSMYAPTPNATTLSVLEKKQQETEQNKSELHSGIKEKTNAINTNQITLFEIMEKITELTNKINEMEYYITEIQEEINQRKIEIDEVEASIKAFENKIAERTELLKERARAIQMSGGSIDYIDVLLSANSFIDFIDRFSAVNTLIEADREIMLQQVEDTKLLAKQKTIVESKLVEQKNRQSKLKELNDSIAAQKKEHAEFVVELSAEQQRLAKAKSELENRFEEELELSEKLEKQIIAEQARLAELARKAEEERKRKAAEEERLRLATSNQSTANVANKIENSPLIRPAAGRHTSGFGGRDIGDGAETHLGYDIANATGTSVVAAADGYVSFAGVMGGYGNVVILTHSINGQTHATVYAHLNSINVSISQFVSQGQQVGGMGNTGRSTGTHVHFEVHVGPWNGSRSNAVDPAQYIW
ncbi:murein hydrolase activator EnvC family protein [Planococcus halocryophilus]|uniref:murein hydrolase activator EnvC family protein n=1 Tax=Planococcus halocryophilus TaxID=1215089 RepID=UPI0012EC383D|nr:M23 family metallopeptidase [Planococcus halocryophilus]